MTSSRKRSKLKLDRVSSIYTHHHFESLQKMNTTRHIYRATIAYATNPRLPYQQFAFSTSTQLQKLGKRRKMPTSEIRDKHGQTIHEGDHVYTPFRGGRHEGDVEKIVTTKQEADEEGVKNPPKVGSTGENVYGVQLLMELLGVVYGPEQQKCLAQPKNTGSYWEGRERVNIRGICILTLHEVRIAQNNKYTNTSF